MNVLALKGKQSASIAFTLPPRLGTARLMPAEPQTHLRRKLWDLSTNLHCSLIGTSLTCGELRRIVIKIQGASARKFTDHEIHQEGVKIASRQTVQAKLLQKALDTRHASAIRKFAPARSAGEILSMWDAARDEGEIPGAYWAALTHPATDLATLRHIFGDVHMLSHLVGSANRADIRRLAELETLVDQLQEKLLRQQARIHAVTLERDAKTRALDEALTASIQDAAANHASVADDDQIRSLAQRLSAKLEREAAHRAQLEEALSVSQADRGKLRQECDRAREAEAVALQELCTLEDLIERSRDGAQGAGKHRDLLGLRLLYVGGRKHLVPSLQATVEETRATFTHHDGGIEDAVALLQGLISQADVVVFPVDCISHNAVVLIKKLTRQFGRSFIPLPRSGLGSLLTVLNELPTPSAQRL